MTEGDCLTVSDMTYDARMGSRMTGQEPATAAVLDQVRDAYGLFPEDIAAFVLDGQANGIPRITITIPMRHEATPDRLRTIADRLRARAAQMEREAVSPFTSQEDAQVYLDDVLRARGVENRES